MNRKEYKKLMEINPLEFEGAQNSINRITKQLDEAEAEYDESPEQKLPGDKLIELADRILVETTNLSTEQLGLNRKPSPLNNYYPYGTGNKTEVESKILKDEDKGLRASVGKIRFDLLEPFAIEQVARIFTKGAAKYSDNNWLKGMKWSKMIASLERHISAFKNGEDYDFDKNCEGCKTGTCLMHTGELHIAQAAWNALGLTSYYKYYPQGDDRLHNVLESPKVGLDIDEVIVDWIGPWTKKFNYPTPTDWDFSYDNKNHFKNDFSKEEINEFYSNLPAKIKPNDITFPIAGYVTSRSVPTELTEKWIQNNGFPTVPVYSVGIGQSKVEAIKKAGITHFIDDNYYNFIELNKAGIACFLLTTPHNEKFNVGYRRINNLQEFAKKYIW